MGISSGILGVVGLAMGTSPGFLHTKEASLDVLGVHGSFNGHILGFPRRIPGMYFVMDSSPGFLGVYGYCAGPIPGFPRCTWVLQSIERILLLLGNIARSDHSVSDSPATQHGANKL